MTSKRSRLKLIFIKPSKYDDDGYVIRYWKGVLPNNTLSVLCGLTEDLKKRNVLSDIIIEYDAYDEMVSKIPIRKIVKEHRRRDQQVLVCLVGVQTNQFPRAFDLAKQLREHDVQVIIGGFHVSGTVNVLGEDEPEIKALRSSGISYFVGEVEELWPRVLEDASQNKLQPCYRAGIGPKQLPCLTDAPMPVVPRGYMNRFAYSSFGTLDTSRGCPFGCSFCTVINVQGRKLRERSPAAVKAFLRSNFNENGVDFYFFTDDNFSRKKLWKETFEEIISLREEEDIPITFMMQVDLARKPDEFVTLAARAGCTQVFIGMESVNPDNLNAEGKKQNKTEEYADIIACWRTAGIAVHAAYIIGFPFDTAEQVHKDIEYLRDKVQPDQASFFMLTPLPGSEGHLRLKQNGNYMDPDFNKRDSFHATTHHPNMSEEEWIKSYQDAWKVFYDNSHLIKILERWNHHPKTYWGLLSIFFWYLNSVDIEGEHPMISGFFRLKDRKTRRPGYTVENPIMHYSRRGIELSKLTIAWGKLFLRMKEVWWRSRQKSEREKRYIRSIDLLKSQLWSKCRVAEWQEGYVRLKGEVPVQLRNSFHAFYKKSQKTIHSPREMQRFFCQWVKIQSAMKKFRKSDRPMSSELHDWILQMTENTRNQFSFSRFSRRLELIQKRRSALPVRIVEEIGRGFAFAFLLRQNLLAGDS